MNTPIDLNNKKIVVVGMGGGFDILGSLPFINDYNVVGLASLNTTYRRFTATKAEELPESMEYKVQQITGKLWFFDLDGVSSHNLVVNKLENTNTWTDVMTMYKQCSFPKRTSVRIHI